MTRVLAIGGVYQAYEGFVRGRIARDASLSPRDFRWARHQADLQGYRASDDLEVVVLDGPLGPDDSDLYQWARIRGLIQ